jgi:chromosome segregation ATPase
MDTNIITALIGLGGVLGGGLISGGVTYALMQRVNKAQANNYVADAFQKLAASLQDRIDDLEDEVKGLKATNIDLEKENDALNLKIECLEADLKNMRQVNDDLRKNNEYLQAENKKVYQQVTALQSKGVFVSREEVPPDEARPE